MITGLLLLPVTAILVWLYWYALPGRSWKWVDSAIFLVILVLMAIYVRQLAGVQFEHSGPMYIEIMSVFGAYTILISGFGAALWWRRRQGSPRQ